jgi:hypothetical protein
MSVFTSEWLSALARKAAEEVELPPTSRPTGKPTGPKRMVLSSELLSAQGRRVTPEEDLPPTSRPTGKPLGVRTLASEEPLLPPPFQEKLRALWEERKKKGHQETLHELCALLLERAFHQVEEDDVEEGTQAP